VRPYAFGTRDMVDQKIDQPTHALNLVEDAAEPLVVDAVFQCPDAILKPNLPVLVPEKTRVSKARTQDALVAGDDGLAAIRRYVVGDEQEMRRRPAIEINTRKISLMRPHCCCQHFGRQAHEIRVDCASQHDWKFGQAGELVEQTGIGFEGNPQFRRPLVELGADHLPAAVLIEDDVSMSHLFDVRFRTVDANRAGRHATMAASRADDRHAVERKRHHLTVEQADN